MYNVEMVESIIEEYFDNSLVEKTSYWLDIMVDFDMSDEEFDLIPEQDIIMCDIEVTVPKSGIIPKKPFDTELALYKAIERIVSKNSIVKSVDTVENHIFYDVKFRMYDGSVFFNDVNITKSDILDLV